MLGKWVFLIEHWEISSPRLSSVFQGGCPDLGNNLAPSPSTFLIINYVLEWRCACPQRGLLLQPLQWCCVDCMLHHKRDVREEQKYLYVARTSNNRVIPMEWSWWVTSNSACEPGEQLIVLAKGDDESDLVGWSLSLLAAMVRSFVNLPLGLSDRNNSRACTLIKWCSSEADGNICLSD